MLSSQALIRKIVFSSTFAFTLLGSALAYAAPFQAGKSANCTNSNICRLRFAGPSPGKTLTVEHMTCKVLTTTAAPAWVVQMFDGTHALYLNTEIQDDAQRSLVAGGPVTFRTRGTTLTVEALLGGFMDSQLSCTITGQTN